MEKISIQRYNPPKLNKEDSWDMDYKHFLEILISKIKNNYLDAEV